METEWALSLKIHIPWLWTVHACRMQEFHNPHPMHNNANIDTVVTHEVLIESSLASHMLHIHGMNQVNLRFLASIITSWKSKLSTNHKRVFVIPEIITDCFPSSIDAIFYCPFIWYTTTTQVHTAICAYFYELNTLSKIECIYICIKVYCNNN